MNTPKKWSDFDKYLRGEHLERKTFTLTIARIEIEETHPRPGQVQLSPVAYFRETRKGLILSPTNQRAIAAAFGDDIAQAVGGRVTLRAEAMRVAGQERLPVRLSIPAQTPAATNAPAANGQAQAAAEEPRPEEKKF